MIWTRDEDTAVVGAESPPERDGPEPLEPVFEAYPDGEWLIIFDNADHTQSIATDRPVEIEQ